MTAFVVVYDRRRLHAEITEFDGDDAVRRASILRSRLESANDDRNVEIVSLFADSLADLRRTHSRYFLNAPRMVVAG